jgi:hypothetical protein
MHHIALYTSHDSVTNLAQHIYSQLNGGWGLPQVFKFRFKVISKISN